MPTTVSPPRTTRDPWLDNAKMTLVTLVVVGHAWVLLPQDGLAGQLYDFLYFWHMPAFVLVTGYLSRGFALTRPRLWALVRTVAVPYVLFETALALFRVHVGGERLDDLFLDPHWPLWYLAALFIWRLVTPFFRDLRGGLALAVGLSLAGGMWAGDTLDLARVVGFLPFFVLGLKATPQRLEWLRTTPARVAAVVTLPVLFVIAGTLEAWAGTEWLFYRSYETVGSSDGQALLVRAALLTIGLAGALSFLALVPRADGWFARMGSATLVVYLFHGFVVKGMGYLGFGDVAADHTVPAAVAVVLGGVGLALALASPPVASRLSVLVDPFGPVVRRSHEAVDLTLEVAAHEDTTAEREAAVRRAAAASGLDAADPGSRPDAASPPRLSPMPTPQSSTPVRDRP